jgi:ureidoacrylate peracid hydrolase
MMAAKMVTPAVKDTALVLVDMQNGFCKPGGTFDRAGVSIDGVARTIDPCARLVAAAHDSQIPVIFTQAWFRADGADTGFSVGEIMQRRKSDELIAADSWDAEIIEELRPQLEDFVVRKFRFSPFHGSGIEPLLSALRVGNLVVCGLTTSICVESTVRDASARDYRVFVPEDAVAEYDPGMHAASLRVMEYCFAYITSTQAVVEAWQTAPADQPRVPEVLEADGR